MTELLESSWFEWRDAVDSELAGQPVSKQASAWLGREAYFDREHTVEEAVQIALSPRTTFGEERGSRWGWADPTGRRKRQGNSANLRKGRSTGQPAPVQTLLTGAGAK